MDKIELKQAIYNVKLHLAVVLKDTLLSKPSLAEEEWEKKQGNKERSELIRPKPSNVTKETYYRDVKVDNFLPLKKIDGLKHAFMKMEWNKERHREGYCHRSYCQLVDCFLRCCLRRRQMLSFVRPLLGMIPTESDHPTLHYS